MPKLLQKVYWRSYKIEGKWYEGVIIDIVTKKKTPVYIIQTELHGIHNRVERTETDIKNRK